MLFSAGSGALELIVAATTDALVRAVVEREIEGLAAALAPWGRFSRPVHLRTTLHQTELREAAPCPTELHLRGVAGLDSLVLLAPAAWPQPPAPRAIEALLLHELAHVLLFQRCTPPGPDRGQGGAGHAYVPTWFREGMATVAAEGPPHPSLRRTLAAHPRLTLLAGADDAQMAADPEACYQAAALLFQAWLERWGARGLSALCREMRAGHTFATAHERATGVAEARFLSGWVDGVRAEARLA